jgi:hypothetical protein
MNRIVHFSETKLPDLRNPIKNGKIKVKVRTIYQSNLKLVSLAKYCLMKVLIKFLYNCVLVQKGYGLVLK